MSLNKQTDFFKKIDINQFFHKSISTFMHCDDNHFVNISDIKIMESVGRRGLENRSYLVEFKIQEPNGLKSDKIIAKQINKNLKFYSHLKINENYFSKTLSIKIPVIKHIDYNFGFIFREYIFGTNIDEILNQIFLQKSVEDWHIRLFENIGRGLAELNHNLNMVHGDSRTSNWIFDDKNNIIFLIDWDVAGIGDPGYDLSKLIYSIGRKFSKTIRMSDLESQDQMIMLFDQICLAILTGYSKIDLAQSTIKNFTKYGIYYVFSVSPQIHKRIFYYSNYSSLEFRLLSKFLYPFLWLNKFK
ncbi:MAG: aminoglycoside phosphotransferase family protein [Candidatus Bathyarchaeota archaeon]